jgi:hypothetical protein
MFGQLEFQRVFLERHAQLVCAIDRFTRKSEPTMKALTVFLYAWSAFAVSLTLATVINIMMVLF